MSVRTFLLATAAIASLGGPVSAQSRSEMETMRAQLEEMQRMNAELMRRLEALEAARSQEAAPTQTAVETMVSSGQKNTRLSVYGQVNRAMLFADNGSDSEVFFVDGDASSTRFGLIGESDVDGTTLGGQIEIELESNSSNDSVSGGRFGPSNGDFKLKERRLEVFAKNKSYGDGYLGQGSTASDGTTEVSFSGTAVAGGYSDISSMAGAIAFSGTNNSVRVRDVFSNFDGNSRQDRIRYDSPSFSGFRIGASVADKGDTDIAAQWAGEFDGGAKVAAAGHVLFLGEKDNRRDFDVQYGGSASALYGGFNVTLAAAARGSDDADRDPLFLYGSVGYTTSDLTSLGSTSFSLDYGYNEDVKQRDDEAQTFGIFAVQKIDKAATDLYAGLRWYDLDRDGLDTDSITAVWTGARLRF